MSTIHDQDKCKICSANLGKKKENITASEYQQREQMRELLRSLTKKLYNRILKKEMYGQSCIVITEWDYGDAIAQVKKEFNL